MVIPLGKRFRNARRKCARVRAFGGSQLPASWRRPNGHRKMPVIQETRDDVPMQVRDHISQTRQIDFVRMHQFSQCRLGGENHVHQALTLFGIQLGHFADMLVKNDAAKARIFRICNETYPAKRVTP